MKILISDPTLRDGNHAVSHQLSLDNFASYCQVADTAGIDIVEVGHGNGLGASSILVGLAKETDIDILTVCRNNLKKSLLGVHVIPGFCTIKKDLAPAVELGVDVFRIASHCTEADVTERHINYIRNMNRIAYGVLMMSHMTTVENLVSEAKKMQSYGAQAVIIMDSSGHFLPDDVRVRISALRDNLDIAVGFHGHNNLGLAVANSIEAARAGALIIDGTTRGFGAGAGNTQLETLIAAFQRLKISTDVNLYHLLDLANFVAATFNKEIAYPSPISIVSGLAGVFSGFAKPVNKAASTYSVDARDIFIELGKRKAVAGQESLILEIAQQLSSLKQRSE